MPDPTLTREQVDEMDLALSTYGSDDRVPVRAGHLKALVALARRAFDAEVLTSEGTVPVMLRRIADALEGRS